MRAMGRHILLSILPLALIACCHGSPKDVSYSESQVNNFMADAWVEGAEVLRVLWRDCSKKLVEVKATTEAKESFPKFVKCMKRKTLRALDRSLSADVVPVVDGVDLVRYEMVDRQGRVMQAGNFSDGTWSEKELEEGEWRTLALQRMARVLRTHVIKLDFGEDNTPEKVEFRHRRRHHMMSMMMFGAVSMGFVLVPMGFQFLAVLGGKALLLAKMALILSSIQGLRKVDEWNRLELQKRKVTASPVNYGFYQQYPYDPHFEQRASASDWLDSGPVSAQMPRRSGPAPGSQPHHAAGDTRDDKLDRTYFEDSKMREPKHYKASVEVLTWTPEVPRPVKQGEPRLYPVYGAGVPSSLAAPAPLADLTTSPAEVHAEYSLDLPLNRIHFQSPGPVISA